MSFREKAKSFFAWLGGALVILAGALVGFLLLRKRPTTTPSPSPTESDRLGSEGEKAVAEAQSEAAQQTAHAEAKHVAATEKLEAQVAVQANGLSNDPSALAHALKSKARS